MQSAPTHNASAFAANVLNFLITNDDDDKSVTDFI